MATTSVDRTSRALDTENTGGTRGLLQVGRRTITGSLLQEDITGGRETITGGQLQVGQEDYYRWTITVGLF